MASTYVNNLRLNEMATGDASGTWGTTTNTNLELVGQALGYGTEAITTNADTHASTVADGAADEARAMYIKYTGTLDSACTITIGPNTLKRVHIIENATSGSQSIIIKQGSGATVTIPTGRVAVVYLDGAGSGAAVTNAFTDLDLAGTLSIAGAVAAATDMTVGDDLTLSSDAGVLGFGADTDVTLTHVADTGLLLNSSRQLQFGDSGTYIHQSADGVLDLVADTEIEINATTIDINGAVDISGNALVSGEVQTANIGYTDGDNAIVIADGGGITAAAGITSTAASNTFGATSFNDAAITNVGSIALDSIINDADQTDILIDAAGTITLDAGNAQIIFKDDGTSIGRLENSSSDFVIKSMVDDKDIIFKGEDGGSNVVALTLDMSAAGAATFNDKIIATELDISGDIDIDGTSNLDTVDIDGPTNIAGAVTITAALTSNGGVVFNEGSADVDFRVESNGQTHAFYVDGGTNAIGIGTTPPTDSHTGWNQVFIGQKGSLISENATGTHGLDGMHITDNLYMDADTGSFANIETNESSVYQQEGGIHKFFSQASGSAGAAVTLAEQARITTDGIALSTNKYFGDSSDTDNYLQFNQANTFRFVTGDVTSLTSTASVLVINEDSANLDTRIESDDNANMFVVDAGGNDVRIGSATSYVSANLQVTQNDGTEKHLIALSSGVDSTISGSGQSAKFVEGVVACNTTSAGNTISIPITSQVNLWRQYQVELMVASAEYNSSSAQAKGGTASFGMTSLSSLNVGNVVVTGNISGVSANGMNIEVEFTSAFTSGLNNYEGCVMHYKVIGITPEYFQGWAATLD